MILGSLLVGAGLAGIIVALVADLISVNRKLLEKIDGQVRELQEQVSHMVIESRDAAATRDREVRS